MSASLFRKEALEHRKDRLFGEVILLQPLSMTILVSVVVIVCALILTILFWGSYARKETVHGYLFPDKGIVKTYAPQAGNIAEVHVREGDKVEEDQVLVTILSERSLQGGSDMDSLLLKEYENTREHQLDQISGEKKLFTSETERLKNKIDGLRKGLIQIEESLKTQQDRMGILESRVQGAKKLLDSKNISQTEYQKLYEELLVQQQRNQELQRALAEGQNALYQAQTELDQLPIRSKSRITDLENSISDLKRKHLEVEGRRSFEIRAPIAGTVTALQAREGQSTNNNTPLLAILPNSAKMQADLFIDSRAIGFIETGQQVRIRYDAFPYRRFGSYEGTVAVISKHVLLPSELPIPLDIKVPVYRVTVDINQQNVAAYGKEFPLQAGMSLEADIVLDKQTLIEWILDPILSIRGKF